MSKDVTCTCKACQNTVFHRKICKFMGLLLPSSSWLLKFPTDWPIRQRLLISKVLANYCCTWRFTHSLIFMSRIATQTHIENDILYMKSLDIKPSPIIGQISVQDQVRIDERYEAFSFHVPDSLLRLCRSRSQWVGACNSHTKPMSRHFYRLIYF